MPTPLYPDDWDPNDPEGYLPPLSLAWYAREINKPTPTYRVHGTRTSHIPREEDTMSRKSRAEQLRSRLDDLLSEINRLENRPEEPTEYVDGVPPIIHIKKRFPGSTGSYDFAFIRAGDGYWYGTNVASPKKKTWDQIMDWVEQGNDELPDIYLVTGVKILGEEEDG